MGAKPARQPAAVTAQAMVLVLREELRQRRDLIAALKKQCGEIRGVLAALEGVPAKRRGRPHKEVKVEVKAMATREAASAKKTERRRPRRQAVNMATSFSRLANTTKPSTMTVPCIRCGERFNNARDLGIHTSRVHFGAEAEA